MRSHYTGDLWTEPLKEQLKAVNYWFVCVYCALLLKFTYLQIQQGIVNYFTCCVPVTNASREPACTTLPLGLCADWLFTPPNELLTHKLVFTARSVN